VVTAPPSRLSAQFQRDIDFEIIQEATRDRTTLKALALRRDNFCCVVTKRFDIKSAKAKPEIVQPGTAGTYTQAVHVLPFSPNEASTRIEAQRPSAIWEIIKKFSGIQLNELSGDRINCLENVITLCYDAHIAFGNLSTWLEPIEEEPHHYRLRKNEPYILSVPDGSIIRFDDHGTGLPLPDRRYLALHAACARVAHASGAGDLIDEYLCDLEKLKVLSEDGSSMQSLENALAVALILV